MHKYAQTEINRRTPTYNLSVDSIQRNIYDRLHFKDLNYIAAVTGDTGSGKTGSAITMCEMIDVDSEGYTRWYYYKKDGSIILPKVVFTASHFLDLVKKASEDPKFLPKGSMILWDEAGVEQSNLEFMSTKAMFISKILQTYRLMNLGLILTVPNIKSIQIATRRLMHAVIHVLNYDPPQPYTRADCRMTRYKWLVKKGDTDEIYGKKEIYFDPEEVNRFQKVDEYYIPSPKKEVYDAYNVLKKEQLDNWYGGMQAELKSMYELMSIKPNKVDLYNERMAYILDNPSDFMDDNGKFKSFLLELNFPELNEKQSSKMTSTLNFYQSAGKLDELEQKISEKLTITKEVQQSKQNIPIKPLLEKPKLSSLYEE